MRKAHPAATGTCPTGADDMTHGRGDEWLDFASRVAATDCAILLLGETGAGKGWLARWIHQRSRRADHPFIPVNCGAIPDSLIDSQLFGHARGSFSGATGDHLGLIRAAEGGTLLLDEIADLPLTAQTRLLRLLEEREVQPLGYSRPVTVNVRIIAATSADLSAAVRDGRFRQDLYFRLDVVRLLLPPLRERREEVASLLNAFNAEFARLYRHSALAFDRVAMRAILQHHWPGNVRELRILVERLHVLCGVSDDQTRRTITADDLRRFGQLRAQERLNVGPASLRLRELKIETVNEALGACNGNMSRAAHTLGVHRSTLYRWLTAQQRLSA